MEQGVARSMTYRGSEMSALMGQIRRELGDEAVILSTRRIGTRLLEVVAGNAALAVRGSGFADASLREALLSTGSAALARRSAEGGAQPKSSRTLPLLEILSAHGIDPRFFPTFAAAPQAASAELQLARGFADLLRFDPRLPGANRFVAFVGQTGAGKTTTIAKLAARLQMAAGVKVAFISMDNFRVGAGFQLQTYASLLRMPCRMLDPRKPAVEELARAREALSRFDLILIDTAGCSPRDETAVGQLGEVLGKAGDIESMLVIPAAGNERDCSAALEAFGRLGCRRIVLSKIDESGYIGPVLNSLMRSDGSLAFFTTGQRVPEDIEPASARRLAWMLTKTAQQAEETVVCRDA